LVSGEIALMCDMIYIGMQKSGDRSQNGTRVALASQAS
jgi:hypothetical protein